MLDDIFLMDVVEYVFSGLSPIESRIYSLYLQGEAISSISAKLGMPSTYLAGKLEKIKNQGRLRMLRCA